MSTQHTPGPWHRNIRADGKYPVVFAGRNQYVAITSQQKDPAETEANIDLICAAPDLLAELRKARAALQESLDQLIQSHTDPATGLITDDAGLLAIESNQDLINSIDATIAKATGETK